MIFEIDTAAKQATAIPVASLATLGYLERYDLQEWVIHNPALLGEDLLVITSEFSGFDRTSERLDILAIDRNAKLVVVELKRSAVRTSAELQALRYAAFCSGMSLEDIFELYAAYLKRRGSGDASVSTAEARIRAFVATPAIDTLDNQPRIILAAEEYGPELTATVLWLRTFNVDITCVRLRPYKVGDTVLIDSAILIPLPEAKEYEIRRERKEAVQATDSGPVRSADEFLAAVSDEVRPLLVDIRSYLVSQQDTAESVFKSLMGYRRSSDKQWITWIVPTKYELRVAVPEELAAGSDLYVRMSGDWPMLRVRDATDAARVKALLAQRMAALGIRRNDDPNRPNV